MPVPQQRLESILSGDTQGIGPTALRTLLTLAEPFYASAMLLRNALYNAGAFSTHQLSRPTVSIGNITTGGSGKTPTVQWLANALRDQGRRPAILLRGYGAKTGQSDEAKLLAAALQSPKKLPIPVKANPNRRAAAKRLFDEQDLIDTFILDDAFQHRQVARDFNLVVVSAVDPFGDTGHVLPRGLLREPMRGLKRANAFLITRSNQVSDVARAVVERRLDANNPQAPFYRADHAHTALIAPDGRRRDLDQLSDTPFYAFAGIGNPLSLHQQLQQYGSTYIGAQWFPDHHNYTPADLKRVRDLAHDGGAMAIVTTAKDWVKIAPLAAADKGRLPIWVLKLELRFWPGDEAKLLASITQKLSQGLEQRLQSRRHSPR